jgi:hypothetical protein
MNLPRVLCGVLEFLFKIVFLVVFGCVLLLLLVVWFFCVDVLPTRKL